MDEDVECINSCDSAHNDQDLNHGWRCRMY